MTEGWESQREESWSSRSASKHWMTVVALLTSQWDKTKVHTRPYPADRTIGCPQRGPPREPGPHAGSLRPLENLSKDNFESTFDVVLSWPAAQIAWTTFCLLQKAAGEGSICPSAGVTGNWAVVATFGLLAFLRKSLCIIQVINYTARAGWSLIPCCLLLTG